MQSPVCGSMFTLFDETVPDELDAQLSVPAHKIMQDSSGRCRVEKSVMPLAESHLAFGEKPGRQTVPSASLSRVSGDYADNLIVEYSALNAIFPEKQNLHRKIADSICSSPRTIVVLGKKVSLDAAVYTVVAPYVIYRSLIFVHSMNQAESLAATLSATELKVILLARENIDEDAEFDVAICWDQKYANRKVRKMADIVVVCHPWNLTEHVRVDLADMPTAHVVAIVNETDRMSATEREQFTATWGTNEHLFLDSNREARSISVLSVKLRTKIRFCKSSKINAFEDVRREVYRSKTVCNEVAKFASNLQTDNFSSFDVFRGLEHDVFGDADTVAIVAATVEQFYMIAIRNKHVSLLVDDPTGISEVYPQLKKRLVSTLKNSPPGPSNRVVYLTTDEFLQNCPVADIYVDLTGGTGKLRIPLRHRLQDDCCNSHAFVLAVKFEHYRAGVEAHKRKMQAYASSRGFYVDGYARKSSANWTRRAHRSQYVTGDWRKPNGRRGRRRESSPLDENGRPTSMQRYGDEFDPVRPGLDTIDHRDFYEAICLLASYRHGPSPGPDGVSPRDLSPAQYAEFANILPERLEQAARPAFQPEVPRVIEKLKNRHSTATRPIAIRNMTDRTCETVLYEMFRNAIEPSESLGKSSYCVPGRGGKSMIAAVFRRFAQSKGKRHFLALADLKAAFDNVPTLKGYQALRSLDVFDQWRGTDGRFPTGTERMFRLVRKFLTQSSTRTRGIDQGSPLSMLVLDALLLNVHDQPLGDLVGRRFVFRYVDNVAYLTTCGNLGDRALGIASTRFDRLHMPLDTTGESYGVFDLCEPVSVPPVLLGFQLSAAGSTLQAALPSQWEQGLAEHIAKSFESPHPVASSRATLKQWISYFSLCGQQRATALSGICTTLRNNGLSELTTPSFCSTWENCWDQSHLRWQNAISPKGKVAYK